jgi:hypothetical protein
LNHIRNLTLGLALGASMGSAHAFINITYDYRFDTTGFFTDERKATLEQAAQAFESRIFDDLTAIVSTPGGNGINANAFNTQISNLSVAAGELIIFVGATPNVSSEGRNTSVPVAGQMAGFNGLTSTSDQTINSPYMVNARERGQTGWPDSDVSTWGGQIQFDSTKSWYADTDASTVESFAGQYDLYSATLKGLLSVFGADQNNDGWANKLSGQGAFNGAKAKAEYNVVNSRGILQAIPTDDDAGNLRMRPGIQGKLADGTLQTLVFSSGLAMGERRYMTELDYAMLDDMGWDVSGFTEMPVTPPVPEPQAWLLLAAGLGLIAHRARARSTLS